MDSVSIWNIHAKINHQFCLQPWWRLWHHYQPHFLRQWRLGNVTWLAEIQAANLIDLSESCHLFIVEVVVGVQYKDHLSKYSEFHCQYNMVVGLPYLYNANLLLIIVYLYMEIALRAQISFRDINVKITNVEIRTERNVVFTMAIPNLSCWLPLFLWKY